VLPNEGKKLLDKVEIPKSSVLLLENGTAFAKLLKELSKLHAKAA
jgi:hypothetical protein